MPKAYFAAQAKFTLTGPNGRNFNLLADLNVHFGTEAETEEFLNKCANATFAISNVESKTLTRQPAPPFTTSTLQQEAGRKLGFPVSLTMSTAQALYEAGLITYMRTDSVNLSELALSSAQKAIGQMFGPDYYQLRRFKTHSKGAQEAHEAIRPTAMENTEAGSTPQEKKLYELIWKRTVASQMADAKVLRTDIKVSSDKASERFCVQATEVLFDGFLKLYIESSDDPVQEDDITILPQMNIGDRMIENGISAECKFTSAPARYTDASLIKKLEELEIGRPSTYAATITTLTKARGYVIKGDKSGEKHPVTNLSLKKGVISSSQKTETVGAEKNRLLPQDIGMIVTDYLSDHFPTILDYGFTASVEDDFDKIAKGSLQWNKVISDFYGPFHQRVEQTLNNREYSRVSREIGIDPKDGKMLTAKFGQWGPYIQKGDGDDKIYASLAPGQLIESITLEEALKLFELPRTVGQFEGIDIVCTKGRFGPYLKYGDKNISLPKGSDPITISLEECTRLIQESQTKKAGAVLLEFKDADIQVIDGAYGPYIKHAGSNYKIPKGTDATALTEEACKEIISSSSPTSRKKRRG